MNSTHNWLTKVVGSILFIIMNLLVTPIIVGFGVLVSIAVVVATVVMMILIFPLQEVAEILNHWNSGNS
jgi:hypothetical protein